MKTNLDALNAKKKELIKQIDNEILKIQKNNSIFDLNFLENYQNNSIIHKDSLNIHIVFGNKGLDIFLQELTGNIFIDTDKDFLEEDIVDFVLIDSIRNCSYRDIYKFNQDEEFINSFIELLKRYKNYLIKLEFSSKSNYESCDYDDVCDYEFYDYGFIPYSIATNLQRIYKIFCNTCPQGFRRADSIWEAIFNVPSKVVANNSPIDKDNFRKLIIEQGGNPYYLDNFLKKVEKLDLEDALEDLFYIIKNIVCNWAF